MLTHGSAFRHSAGCPVLLQAAAARNIYRLLQGPQGDRLRSVATMANQSYLTAKAVTWLRTNFEKTLNVDALASMAGMSRSTLHHHFRGLTAMSPLQFSKTASPSYSTTQDAHRGARCCERSLRGGIRKSKPVQSRVQALLRKAPHARCTSIAGVAVIVKSSRCDFGTILWFSRT